MIHCLLDDASVVVSASDTDIFMLMIYLFGQHVPNINWYMEIEKGNFIDISQIYDELGNKVSSILHFMFILTGCDTVSYLYRRSEKLIFDRIIRNESKAVELLTNIGENNKIPLSVIDNCQTFIQIFVYNGKESEELVDTHIKHYDSLKTKSTQPILADQMYQKSLTQHIRRANLQRYYWKH